MTYQDGRGSNPLLSKFLEISGISGSFIAGSGVLKGALSPSQSVR